jgi:hypothetical protein
MNLRSIEPRTAMWAVAEVSWEDPTGRPYCAAATLEDTSPSGACIRVKTAIAVGSTLRVKWHREQFSGVARNCRLDGKEFLLGIQREPTEPRIQATPPPQPGKTAEPATEPASTKQTELSWKDEHGTARVAAATVESDAPSWTSLRLQTLIPAGTKINIKGPDQQFPGIVKYCRKEDGAYLLGVQHDPATVHIRSESLIAGPPDPALDLPSATLPNLSVKPDSVRNTLPTHGSQLDLAPLSAPDQLPQAQTEKALSRKERKVMPSTNLFPRFWRSLKSGTSAPHRHTSTEVPVNKPQSDFSEVPIHTQTNLLSCEDIYHASGILSARSGYGIGKIVDMLNNKHIRELANDVKRASVLMALDAAGTTIDDVLQDATRRQHALTSYETGQKKQIEEFEAAKQRENAQLQAEMERVTAHYADRIKRNLEQVAQEKDALSLWQQTKEEESQRISQAAELCAKQPAPVTASEAGPVLARTHAAVGSA